MILVPLRIAVAGVYVHIPFCRQACAYCDFHFSTQLNTLPDMVNAIVAEIGQRADYLGGEKISSVYFGGGTPSLLNVNQLRQITGAVMERFQVDGNAEITLEANPDDLSGQVLKDWRSVGFNRLSIGLQSFNEEELRWMNRAHNAGQGEDAVKRAQDAGYDNISIDLIYGSRFQDLRSWEQTLKRALKLNVQHISSYNLTVEKKTKLGWLVAGGKEKPVDEALSREQFLMMSAMLSAAGFTHYEVSNFALPGLEAVHNSNYWLQHTYLGLGPSAHSFDGKSRQWNVNNNHAYIKAVQSGAGYFEKEELTLKDRYNEYVMTRLRTRWGCDISEMRRKFGPEIVAYFLERSAALRQLIGEKDGKYVLNTEGMLHADGIASDLFFV